MSKTILQVRCETHEGQVEGFFFDDVYVIGEVVLEGEILYTTEMLIRDNTTQSIREGRDEVIRHIENWAIENKFFQVEV